MVYFFCVKFHQNPYSGLGGVPLTRIHLRNSKLNNLPLHQRANIFLHAHLYMVSFHCGKFHENPCCGLGGVALARIYWQTDGRTDRQTNKVIHIYPQTFFIWGDMNILWMGFISIICHLETKSIKRFRRGCTYAWTDRETPGWFLYTHTQTVFAGVWWFHLQLNSHEVGLIARNKI